MEPSEPAYRVLSSMFDADGDDDYCNCDFTVKATRPVQDPGNTTSRRPLKKAQF